MQKNAPIIINWVEETQEYVAFNPNNPTLRAYATTRREALTILEQAPQHARNSFGLQLSARPDRKRLKPTRSTP